MTVLQRGGNIPHGQVEIDGVRYHCGPFDGEMSEGNVTLTFDGFEIINRCESCGRFDTRPRTAHSIEDAIAKGYMVKVEPE